MNHEKQLDAAIVKKENYLDWLEHVGYNIELEIERNLKFNRVNRFLIGAGKFFISLVFSILYFSMLYVLFKYVLFKYAGPHLVSLLQ